MSKNLVRWLQAEIEQLKAQKVKAIGERDAARAALEQFTGGEGRDGRRRRRYEGPIDPETGRTIITCIGCHQVGPLRARSMCASCYAKWRRQHKSR